MLLASHETRKLPEKRSLLLCKQVIIYLTVEVRTPSRPPWKWAWTTTSWMFVMGHHDTKWSPLSTFLSQTHPEFFLSPYASGAWSSKMEATLLVQGHRDGKQGREKFRSICEVQVDLRTHAYSLLDSLAELPRYPDAFPPWNWIVLHYWLLW